MATSSTTEIAIGTVLSETYAIARLLGEGGMGSVWEASHLRLPGKRCAVKVLHGQAAADQEAYARFRREAEIASRLGHPNIIEVLDWNTLPSGSPYLVLELLQGQDLAARIAAGRMPLDETLAIARQIGSALRAAHQAEVVHRDLKPGNVFLVPREVDGAIVDHVKVLDFGISKIRNSRTVQTQEAVLLGTPQYMAPEQALGKNHEIDARTDQFALAVIVYEMIAGTAPFQGSSLAEVVFKVVYEPVVPLATLVPGLDPGISAAVERAMSKAAADRFPDVSSFISALTGRSLATTNRRAAASGTASVVPPTAGHTAVGALAATGQPPASHLRGELQARPAAPAGSSRLVFLLVAIVIGAGGTIGAVRMLGGRSSARQTPGQHAPPPTPIAAPPVITPPVVKSVAEPVAKKTGEPAVASKKSEHAHVEAPAAVESPELRAILDEAETALEQKDAAQAQRLGDRSLRIQKTSRGFSVLTRAACLLGDLGGVNATYIHVASGDRARVRKLCKSYDIDLH